MWLQVPHESLACDEATSHRKVLFFYLEHFFHLLPFWNIIIINFQYLKAFSFSFLVEEIVLEKKKKQREEQFPSNQRVSTYCFSFSFLHWAGLHSAPDLFKPCALPPILLWALVKCSFDSNWVLANRSIDITSSRYWAIETSESRLLRQPGRPKTESRRRPIVFLMP